MPKLAPTSFLALLAACAADLPVPGGAVVECSSDAECPEDYLCDEETSRCYSVQAGLETPPSLIIGTIDRQLGPVSFSITVTDNESDAVTLAAAYDAGGGYQPATLTHPALAGSRAGRVFEGVTWDVAADLPSVTYNRAVRLRITPSDASGAGEPVESGPFALGNSPPTLSQLGVVSDVMPVQGNVIVRFIVADSAADVFDIVRLEVSYDGSFSDSVTIYDEAGAATAIASGAVRGLLSSTDGTEHRFTWSSLATSIVDAPLARLRLTVRDAFGGEAATTSSDFYLRNQVPPRISNLRAPAAAARRVTGPVTFAYRLIDDNNDPADVAFDYSLDGGLSFVPCREYRVPESEGTFGLAASSEASGGVEHVFVWDAAGVSLSPISDVVVRARPASGGAGEQVAMGAGAGPPLLSPYDDLFNDVAINLAGGFYSVVGEFTGDGRPDLVLSQGSVEYRAAGCSPAPCFGSPFGYTPPPAGGITGFAAADLDGDGGDDLVVARSSPNRLTVRFFDAFATSVDLAALPAAPLGAHVADVDGDGHLDLVAETAASVLVQFGDGTGAFGAPVATPISGVVVSAELANIDGDARSDVWALHASSEQKLTALVATGNRTTPFVTRTSDLPARAGFLAVSDANGDGRSEVVLSGAGATEDLAARAMFISSDDAGGLRANVVVPVGDNRITDIAAADVTGDGRADLVWGEHATTAGYIYMRPNLGTGDDGFARFGEPVYVFRCDNAERITFGDFDGDGSQDPVAATTFSAAGYVAGARRVTSGLGAGGAVLSRSYWTGTADYEGYATGDFDGDGSRDHAFFDGYGDAIEMWMGDAIRGVASDELVGPILAADCPSCTQLAAGDANADGLSDLWYMDAGGAGRLRLSNGDTTFAAATASALPAGFARIGEANFFQTVPTGDFDGDGILDAIWDGSGSTTLRYHRGFYPGTPGPDGPALSDFVASPLTFPVLQISGFNAAFVGDVNADGLVDTIVNTRRFTSEFYVIFGQLESPLPRELALEPFATTPAKGARLAASAFGQSVDDLQGEVITGHVARAALHEHIVNWKQALFDAGQVDAAARPLTAPYQLAGDVRLTATSSNSAAALRLEARLGARAEPASLSNFARRGLDLTTDGAQRGVVVDLPIFAGYSGAQLTSGTIRVFLRRVDYTGLGAASLRRKPAWQNIARDTDGLATGTGARFMLATAGDGSTVVRVLLDQLGVVQAYINL